MRGMCSVGLDGAAVQVSPRGMARKLSLAGFERRGSRWYRVGSPGYAKIGRYDRHPPARWVVWLNDECGRGRPLDGPGFAHELLGVPWAEVPAFIARIEAEASQTGAGGGAVDARAGARSGAPVWPPLLQPVIDAASVMTASGIPIDPVGLAWTRRTHPDLRLIDRIADQLGPDGRWHPQWHPAALLSGRCGGNPHPLDVSKVLRPIICASPGCVLIEADLRAAGLTACAALSADAALARVIAAEDPWLRLASDLVEVPDASVAGALRETIKGFATAALDSRSLSLASRRLASVPVEARDRILIGWQSRFHRLIEWRVTLDQRRQRGEGIQLAYPGRAVQGTEHVGQVVALLGQSLIAAHVDHALVAIIACLRAAGDPGAVIAHIHDGLLAEARADAAPLVAQILIDALTVPLPGTSISPRVRLAVGHRWGQLHSTAEATR